jgi:ATP/maltotriose-dependent transcriptional regulator MalT
MRRVLDEAQDRLTRSRLLPAYVEIMLATGAVDAARAAADELIAGIDDAAAPFLRAAADRADGEVLLAEGEPRASLGPLRRAWSEWQALEMPYEAARVRVLIARACRELGDDDSSDLEIDAARWAFELLGAAADLARLDAVQPPAAALTTPLTPRELEVLRLVAAGNTNRHIASELVISEKTVARHVSNILAKLGLPSRAGATAYAYEQGLV